MIATLKPVRDETQVADFVRCHQRELLRYARVLGCSDALADELIQDAFVTAWRKGAICGERRRDAGFLRKLVRDRWVDEQRARRRAAALHDTVEDLWVEQPEHDAWLAALATCRARLTGRSADAVAAVYDRGLDREQAASELGMRPNGIKTLLQRTRRALRECVETQLQEENR